MVIVAVNLSIGWLIHFVIDVQCVSLLMKIYTNHSTCMKLKLAKTTKKSNLMLY